MKKIIYIFILLLSTLSPAQNEELFAQGNSLYNDGKFQDAINTYEGILNAEPLPGGGSGDLANLTRVVPRRNDASLTRPPLTPSLYYLKTDFSAYILF